MANTQIKDATGATVYVKSTGVGSDGDPRIHEHLETNSGSIKTAVEIIDNIVKAEDAAHNSGDSGVMLLGVRKDSAGTLASNDGDYTPAQMDPYGSLRVAITSGSSANTEYTEGDTDASITGIASMWEDTGNTLRATSATYPMPTTGSGNVAHDAADSGNPIKIGGKARTTNPTAVADADRVDGTFDKIGRQVVTIGHVRELVAQNTITLANTSEATLLAAGGAGVYHDLTHLTITNSSASAVVVYLRDATAGSIIDNIAIAAGGGITKTYTRPWKQTTANSNWTAQLSGSVSSVYITVQAEKNV